MRKRYTFLFTLLVSMALIFSSLATAQEKITIKLAHESSVEHDMHMTYLFYAKRIAEKTNGNVEIKIFPSGQLGNEAAIYEGVKLGTIDSGSGGLFDMIDPLFNVIGMPFLYRDYDHIHKVWDGPIGDELGKRALKNGYKIMAPFDNGFRYFYNNKRPIWKPEDLKGLKLRVPPIQTIIATVQAFNAVPQSVPYGEVYTATKQGVVDGGEQSLPSITGMKFYEVMNYLTLLPYVYAGDAFIMNAKLWNSLPAKVQNVLEVTAKEEALPYQRKLLKEREDKALDIILKHGVKVNLAYGPAFYPSAQKVYDKYKDAVPEELIKKIRNLK